MHLPFLSLFIFFFNLVANAQIKTEAFAITIPDTIISNSQYNRIRLFDIRQDTTDFGIIQKGAFNRKEKVITDIPFSEQVENLVKALVDQSAKSNELLLLLRQLRFAEVTGGLSERGYFHFRGSLFAREGNQYKLVSRLDTVVVVSALDVTRQLFRTGSKTLYDFIKNNLHKSTADNPVFTIDQLAQMDSIDKSHLALYSNPNMINGAYKNFSSFVNQVPDNELRIKYSRNGSFESIQVKNRKGKFEEAVLKNWYALVYQDKVYISTDYGIYPLQKKGNDFYFIGKASVPASTGEMITAGFFFGLIGAMAMSGGSSGVFEMKLDHISGGFIQVREAKQKEILYQ